MQFRDATERSSQILDDLRRCHVQLFQRAPLNTSFSAAWGQCLTHWTLMSLRAALFEDGHIAFDGAGHDLYQFKYESFARRDKLSHFPSVKISMWADS